MTMKSTVLKKSVEVIEYDLDQSSLQLALITRQLGVFDSDPLFHLRKKFPI